MILGCTMRVPQVMEETVMRFRGMVCAKTGELVVLAFALAIGVGAFGQTKGKTTPKAGAVDPGVRDGSAGGALNSQEPLGWPSLSILERVGHSSHFSSCRWPGFELIPESWGRLSSSLFSGHSTFNF
jgi:hypothetical protein